jgi:hypothetical protein
VLLPGGKYPSKRGGERKRKIEREIMYLIESKKK